MNRRTLRTRHVDGSRRGLPPAPTPARAPAASTCARPLPLPPKPAAFRQGPSNNLDSWWTNASLSRFERERLPLLPPLPRRERQLPLLPFREQGRELLSLEPAGEPESLRGIAIQRSEEHTSELQSPDTI